jgi:hypothetical protein
MIESALDGNAGHETIEAGRNRRPFGMLFANTLLCIDLNKDLLVLSKLGNDDVLMDQLYAAEFGSLVALGNPSQLV